MNSSLRQELIYRADWLTHSNAEVLILVFLDNIEDVRIKLGQIRLCVIIQ